MPARTDLIKMRRILWIENKSSMHFLHNHTCSKFTISNVIVSDSFTLENIKSWEKTSYSKCSKELPSVIMIFYYIFHHIFVVQGVEVILDESF
jgi:hypothetical protein